MAVVVTKEDSNLSQWVCPCTLYLHLAEDAFPNFYVCPLSSEAWWQQSSVFLDLQRYPVHLPANILQAPDSEERLSAALQKILGKIFGKCILEDQKIALSRKTEVNWGTVKSQIQRIRSQTSSS